MKVIFFLGQFPVPSETFVTNQIIGLISLGLDVKILALRRSKMKTSHAAVDEYNLLNKTRYLLAEQGDENKLSLLLKRGCPVTRSILSARVRLAFDYKRFGLHSKKLLLPAAAAAITKPIVSDIIIAHFGTQAVFAHQLQTLGLLKGKLISVFHGVDISQADILKRYKIDYKRLFAEGAAMLPISELWKKLLIEMGCSAGKIQVNRMGIDINDFKCRPIDQALNSQLSVITVARYIDKKGLFDAISAMGIIKGNGIAFQYKIVGDGPLKAQLKQHILNLGLKKDIELTGFQPQETIKSYLREADVFLLPSITAADGDMEGIPIALMEAMAVGLISVSTQHSGIPELIEDGYSGFLAPERSPEQLAAILTSIAQGEVDIQRIRSNAAKTIFDKFNQTALCKQLADIAQELHEH